MQSCAPLKAVRGHRCLCWTSTKFSGLTGTSHQPVRQRRNSSTAASAKDGQQQRASHAKVQYQGCRPQLRFGRAQSTCRHQTRLRTIDSLHTLTYICHQRCKDHEKTYINSVSPSANDNAQLQHESETLISISREKGHTTLPAGCRKPPARPTRKSDSSTSSLCLCRFSLCP